MGFRGYVGLIGALGAQGLSPEALYPKPSTLNAEPKVQGLGFRVRGLHLVMGGVAGLVAGVLQVRPKKAVLQGFRTERA